MPEVTGVLNVQPNYRNRKKDWTNWSFIYHVFEFKILIVCYQFSPENFLCITQRFADVLYRQYEVLLSFLLMTLDKSSGNLTSFVVVGESSTKKFKWNGTFKKNNVKEGWIHSINLVIFYTIRSVDPILSPSEVIFTFTGLVKSVKISAPLRSFLFIPESVFLRYFFLLV